MQIPPIPSVNATTHGPGRGVGDTRKGAAGGAAAPFGPAGRTASAGQALGVAGQSANENVAHRKTSATAGPAASLPDAASDRARLVVSLLAGTPVEPGPGISAGTGTAEGTATAEGAVLRNEGPETVLITGFISAPSAPTGPNTAFDGQALGSPATLSLSADGAAAPSGPKSAEVGKIPSTTPILPLATAPAGAARTGAEGKIAPVSTARFANASANSEGAAGSPLPVTQTSPIAVGQAETSTATPPPAPAAASEQPPAPAVQVADTAATPATSGSGNDTTPQSSVQTGQQPGSQPSPQPSPQAGPQTAAQTAPIAGAGLSGAPATRDAVASPAAASAAKSAPSGQANGESSRSNAKARAANNGATPANGPSGSQPAQVQPRAPVVSGQPASSNASDRAFEAVALASPRGADAALPAAPPITTPLSETLSTIAPPGGETRLAADGIASGTLPLGARAATSAPAAEQIAVQISRAVGHGADKFTVHLHPANLGRVSVELEFGQDGRVHAAIAADRPETLELLQRDARALERALNEAGLKTDSGSLSFNLRGDQDHRHSDGSLNESDGSTIHVPTEEATSGPAAAYANSHRMAMGGGIDIRV